VIAELEAELARRPLLERDRSVLAVYADALQARGDPRGELIAIDLALEQREDNGLRAQRAELLRAWLGDEVVPYVLDHKFGLLDVELRANIPLRRCAPYIARLALLNQTHVGRQLAELAAEPRPWLDEVLFSGARGRKSITDQRVRQLFDATPNLRILRLSRHALRDAVHPTVHRIELLDRDAAQQFDGHGPPFPAVRELAVRIPWGAEAVPVGLHRTPALRRLDLRRAHPTELAPSLEPKPPTFALAELALPVLETARDVEIVQQLLDRWPAVQRVELAGHRGEIELVHPTATILHGPELPWPPLESVLRDGLAIQIDNAVYPVNLVDAVGIMENNYVDLTESVRAAWHRLWPLITNLPHDSTRRRIDRATVQIALRGVDLGRPGYERQPQWVRVREALRGPGDDVSVMWRYA
jgi:hypothetical protein